MSYIRCSVSVLMLLVLVAFGRTSAEDHQSPDPLPLAHAHNDYLHDRPLLDALEHGFCSVEADIFLVEGKLLVAHSRSELTDERTLQSLYLDPLKARVAKNGGCVHADDSEFTLMIDIKGDGESTYAALANVLTGYADMLTSVENNTLSKRAVTVIVSGNRHMESIASDTVRRVGIDGRLSDLSSEYTDDLMPLISDNWRKHFTWRGEGEFPKTERAKLHDVTKIAHDAGRRIRFWATPENEAVWKELYDAGVDHINTDDLPGLQAFLINQSK